MSEVCGQCGAKLDGRWERLTPGIVRLLVQIWSQVCGSGVNSVHLQRDLDLDKNAYCNSNKLRYFGLIAKDRKLRGHWLVTRRGAEFIHGKARVHQKVLIFRNHIKDRSVETVGIFDVLKCDQYWPSKEDFLMPPPMPVVDYSQASQGGLFM